MLLVQDKLIIRNQSFLVANSHLVYSAQYYNNVLFLEMQYFPYRLSPYPGNQMSSAHVSLHTHLAGKGSQTDGRKLECKIISVEEEKQPVGMFPLGCLEWINLSKCLSSVGILYAHTARHACKTSRQTNLYTYDICTHICLMHAPPTALHMVCHFPALPCTLSCFSLSHTHKHTCFFSCCFYT